MLFFLTRCKFCSIERLNDIVLCFKLNLILSPDSTKNCFVSKIVRMFEYRQHIEMNNHYSHSKERAEHFQQGELPIPTICDVLVRNLVSAGVMSNRRFQTFGEEEIASLLPELECQSKPTFDSNRAQNKCCLGALLK